MSAEFVASLRPGDRVLRATRALTYGWLRAEPGDEVWIVASVSPQRSSVRVRREGSGSNSNPEVLRGRALAALRPVDAEFEARYHRDNARLLASQRLAAITSPNLLDLGAVARIELEGARELAEAARVLLSVGRRLGVLR